MQGVLNTSLRSKGLKGNSLRQVGLALDGGKSVHLLDYRRHALDRPLASAVLDDLRRPRSVIRPQDVLGLGPGQALAYGLRGELGLQVRVSLADLITGSVGRIADLARAGRAVGLRVSSGLTAKASIRSQLDRS